MERQDVVVETSTLKVIFRNAAVAGDDEALGVARVKWNGDESSRTQGERGGLVRRRWIQPAVEGGSHLDRAEHRGGAGARGRSLGDKHSALSV